MNQRFAISCRLVVCGIFSVLALTAGCAKPVDHWRAFSPPGGRFSILLPGPAVEQIPKTTTGFEAKKYTIVSAMSNFSGLSVAYADQPDRSGFQADTNKIFDALREQARVDLRGQLLGEKQITLQGYPGRELRFLIADGHTVLQRIYLVNKRLYSLLIIAGSKGIDSPDAERFMNSFKVLP